MSGDEKPPQPAAELVAARISEIEDCLAVARRWLAEGNSGSARVVLAVGCAREISPGIGLGELIEAFERLKPGFRAVLGPPLSLAPAAQRDEEPPGRLRELAAAAARAEQWANLVVEAALTDNAKLVDVALDGLVEHALAAVEAKRSP